MCTYIYIYIYIYTYVYVYNSWMGRAKRRSTPGSRPCAASRTSPSGR